MELLILGHGGARVLVFPTSQGRFFEWEDRGITTTLGEHLEKGWLQLFCVDSVDAESWYARYKHPGARAWRQEQYDRYLLNEVLPLADQINPNRFLITLGSSFGAYHAVNFGLRHPHHVNRILALSGIYDIDRWTDGYHDEMVYFHNPCAYMGNVHDPAQLDAHRHQDIIIVTGQDDPLRYSSEYLSGLLWSNDIWHALRVWDGWAHDWPYWHQMVSTYIEGTK